MNGLEKMKFLGMAFVLCSVSFVSCSDDDEGEKKAGYGEENGHEWVDLGLPSGLKWATCNVGAAAPEQTGEFYAWGEITPKATYGWNNYAWSDEYGNEMTKYTKASEKELELEDDAARQSMGGGWFTPSHEDWDELHDNCTWSWTEQNGVKGFLVTSTSAKTSIFLPAAGHKLYNEYIYNAEDPYGSYWSSSVYENDKHFAYQLYFGVGAFYINNKERYEGHVVRAVCK